MSFLQKFRSKKEQGSLREEILEHLCDLLNTKRGFGSYPIDLGLDSYVYLGSDRKIILQIKTDIENCFQKYEKRVNQVEVIPVPSESRFFLSFHITCKVNDKACSFHLSFHQQNNSYSFEVNE
jgi:predicted component of type VI protein secretion system